MQPTMLNPPPPPPPSASSKLKQACDLIGSIISSNTNGMLAAIISLMVVILFVLMLHAYAKWFLAQACRRSRSRSYGGSASLPHAMGSHFHAFPVESRSTLPSSPITTSSTINGLESSAIPSIPLFVYKEKEHKHNLECVICLNVFEEEEVGRQLPRCMHAFHVECIDMWLHSHVSCPICRVPAINVTDDVNDKIIVDDHSSVPSSATTPDSLVMSNVDNVEEPTTATTTTEFEVVIEVTCSDNCSMPISRGS